MTSHATSSAEHLFLYRNPQRLHLAVHVAALQAQDFGGAADAALIFVELLQDVVALVGARA